MVVRKLRPRMTDSQNQRKHGANRSDEHRLNRPQCEIVERNPRDHFLPRFVLQQLADFIQVFLADFPALREMYQERRCGTVEDALDEVRDHAANDFRARLGGMIDVRSLAGILVQAAFSVRERPSSSAPLCTRSCDA